jgi:hypothetical protein
MELNLPFLYLPDAVTLILLLLALSMLRSAAIGNIRQELLLIRKEMLSFRLNGGRDGADPAYGALRSLVDSSIKLAPELSPARLLFVFRLQRKLAKKGMPLPIPNPALEVNRCIEETAARDARTKLKRLQMEMNLGIGTFFLLGSVSSWVLMFVIVPRLVRRSFTHHPGHRVDAFFDMIERVLSRLGRRALWLATVMVSWTSPGPLPAAPGYVFGEDGNRSSGSGR